MGVVSQVLNLDFGASIQINLDTTDLTEALEERLKHILDVEGVLSSFADILRGEARRSFAEGGPGWKPLAPSTLAQKIAGGYPRRNPSGRIPTRLMQNGQFSAANILIRTGRLRDSWARKDHPEHIEEVSLEDMSVEVGSSVPYAAPHQFGTSAYAVLSSAGKMRLHAPLPQRPVTISQAAITQMEEILNRHLAGEKFIRKS